MTVAESTPTRKSTRNILDSFFRKLVVNRLSSTQGGKIELHDAGEKFVFGQSSDLTTTLNIHRPRFFRQAVLGGSLSVAHAYIHGDWDCDDLTSFFRIFVRSHSKPSFLTRSVMNVTNFSHRIYHWLHDNTRSGSRQNISAHYDVGNDFYRLWLDPTLAYSSGIFPTPDASMTEASKEKFDRVCRKIEVSDNDHLVEIGTGWGGFALHAVENYQCKVTTTTISSQQHEIARERIEASGKQDRIKLLQTDYRDLTGQFDKLVSIEMIEAVGYKHLDQYFSRCSQLLRPDGTMVLQAIVMPERGYRNYLNSVDFIQRYVFPGGCLPSVAAMLESAGRATDLRFVHAEDFAPHYAETLRRWRTAFEQRLDTIRQLGYSEKFIRLWRYYFCYCEAAFEERCVGVVQVQFDKPQCRRDPLNVSKHSATPHRLANHSSEKTSPAGLNSQLSQEFSTHA
jgi:cyclopropane-fatty-acyl-phospholipid synthase